ncbi:hypothetical protein BsWGS_18365 [Bradybaena similaris]
MESGDHAFRSSQNGFKKYLTDIGCHGSEGGQVPQHTNHDSLLKQELDVEGNAEADLSADSPEDYQEHMYRQPQEFVPYQHPQLLYAVDPSEASHFDHGSSVDDEENPCAPISPDVSGNARSSGNTLHGPATTAPSAATEECFLAGSLEEDTATASGNQLVTSSTPKSLKDKISEIPAKLSRFSLLSALRSGTYVVSEPKTMSDSDCDKMVTEVADENKAIVNGDHLDESNQQVHLVKTGHTGRALTSQLSTISRKRHSVHR